MISEVKYILPVLSVPKISDSLNSIPVYGTNATVIVGKRKSLRSPSRLATLHLCFYGYPIDERCKSSLLFQAAVTHAAEGDHVVYISHEPLKRLPLHVHGMPTPDANLLKELKMIYMNTGEELVDYLSGLHESAVVPDVLLIDDLHYYITQLKDGDGERTVAKVCAMLLDAVSYMKLKSGKTATLISTMEDEVKDHLAVVHRLVKNVYYITGCDEVDNKIFQLEIGASTALPTRNEPKTETCTFAIRDNQILLKRVIQESN